jgi:hypothetical protein
MVDNQKSRDEIRKSIESVDMEAHYGAEDAARDRQKQSAINRSSQAISNDHKKSDVINLF